MSGCAASDVCAILCVASMSSSISISPGFSPSPLMLAHSLSQELSHKGHFYAAGRGCSPCASQKTWGRSFRVTGYGPRILLPPLTFAKLESYKGATLESPTQALPTPRAALHAQSGAQLGTWFGCSLPDHFGDWLAEYRHLRESVALLDK